MPVVPYHWDDRSKLSLDAEVLSALYEATLPAITKALNEFHGVDRPLRYWRILIGPWLWYFLQILFDRWTMLERARELWPNLKVRVADRALSETVPSHFADFQRRFVEDDWNEAVYADLLRDSPIRVEWLLPPRARGAGTSVPRPGIRNRLVTAASWTSRWLTRNTDHFLYQPYLGLGTMFRLQLDLGQLPAIWSCVPAPEVSVDETKRSWQLRMPEFEGLPARFLRQASRIIPRQMPTAYVEGFGALDAATDRVPWPRSPKSIVTAAAHIADDVFKAWAGRRCVQGTPLVMLQHGGTYGLAKFFPSEDHEVRAADLFLSWGWAEGAKSVVPLGMLKPNPFAVRRARKPDRLLLTTNVLPRYSYKLCAEPIAGQWETYLSDLFNFVEALPLEVRDQLTVKNPASDYGRGLQERFEELVPSATVVSGGSITRFVRRARLCISTANSTVMLEALAANMPTVVFFRPELNEFRSEAQVELDRLQAAGIFCPTWEDAAAKVLEIWDDVEAWWSSPDVQVARRSFCASYALVPERGRTRLVRELREVGTRPSPDPVSAEGTR